MGFLSAMLRARRARSPTHGNFPPEAAAADRAEAGANEAEEANASLQGLGCAVMLHVSKPAAAQPKPKPSALAQEAP